MPKPHSFPLIILSYESSQMFNYSETSFQTKESSIYLPHPHLHLPVGPTKDGPERSSLDEKLGLEKLPGSINRNGSAFVIGCVKQDLEHVAAGMQKRGLL